MLWAIPATARQPPPVSDTADRPGFADSPVLVGRGHLLVETGFTWEREGSDRTSVRTFTWPQVELHGGISSRLDVAVIWDGLVSARTRTSAPGLEPGDTTTGLDDVRLGVKFGIVHRPRFASALIGYVNVPVGSAVISRRYADPLTRLAWSVAISDRLGVFGTADLKGVKEDDDHVRAKPAASAALSSSLTDSIDGFVGIVTEPPDYGSRLSMWSVEAGLVRAIGERHQIDIWVSRRLVGDLDDWFISAGFIRRLR
jgi:hypothetical protein